MKKIVVLGGGFAGFWSAAGAARKLDELGVPADEISVTLIDQNDYHGIRVRNYERDLDPVIIPLATILDPIGVEHIRGVVVDIDPARQIVRVRTRAADCGSDNDNDNDRGSDGDTDIAYDRLVYALGSQLRRPPIPGVGEHCFDVDTYQGAKRLQAHLASLPGSSYGDEKFAVLVVGAGLTGIETAAEMPERLALLDRPSASGPQARVTLVDSSAVIGSDMGEQARAVIAQALKQLGVQTRAGVVIASVDASGATLSTGERLAAATVVWCAGMRANGLASALPVQTDRLGRLPVDEFMRVKGVENVFAAGDAAWSMMDDTHVSVMSCQHGRPMGRYAGHNVVAEMLGKPMLPLRIEWYVTILDLGAWGAVYTKGWDREVIATGETAKATKRTINGQRIYPPTNANRADILAAAAPQAQTPPVVSANT